MRCGIGQVCALGLRICHHTGSCQVSSHHWHRDQPVADSKQWLSRTLPILSVLSFLSNGATLRLIRHTWAQRVSRAKHTAMLAYLAIAAFINPALPAWALAGVALVAQVMVNLTSFGQVLEAQQRLQFERTAL